MAMRRVPLLVLAGAVLALAACGSGGSGGSAGGPAPTAGAPVTTAAPGGSASTTAPPGVPTPLTFTAPAVLGGEVAGASYAGRDVVVWFWSPW